MERVPALRRRSLLLCLLCAICLLCILYMLYLDAGSAPLAAIRIFQEAQDSPSSFHKTTVQSTTKSPVIAPQLRDGTPTDLPPPPANLTAAPPPPQLILLWTPFFGSWEYLGGGCGSCAVSRDRRRLREASAVVFHCRDLSLADLPPLRLPRQRWVFYCLESPAYSDFPGLAHARRMFNWTMTYRADSDVVAPYGTLQQVRTPRALDRESLRRAWSNKTRSAAWMSSHCPTEGGRDLYVRELRRHIDIDVYGTCGRLQCPQGQTHKCLLDFASKYHFFLAFENALCRDYITEKFFRTLSYDMVPVVFGGAAYRRFAPPNSFVDALAFRSPRHLAYFLRGLAGDFRLWSGYFAWRGRHRVGLGGGKGCALCERLRDSNHSSSSYEDLRKWWVDDAHCTTWKPKR